MKFIVLVEGETEDKGVEGFINRWLTTQFTAGSRVGVKCVRFEGWPELRDETPKRALYMKHLKRKYVKTTAGRNIFPKLDAAKVAEQCPYLLAMLHKLRELVKDAGAVPAGDWDL